MKTKIKILTILIAIFAVTLACGLFAGCGEESPKERADKLGMTACVTYYTNGGNFVSGTNSTDYKPYRTDYYYPDTPIFNIGVDETTGQSLNIKRDGYVFAGWAYALLDGNGLPYLYSVDDNGDRTDTQLEVLENGTASIKVSGREMLEQEKRFVAVVDESRGMVFASGHPKVGANEHKYLVATWTKDVVLEYKLITDEPITVTVEETDEDGETVNKYVTYNSGDVIHTRSFAVSDTLTLFPDSVPADFDGFSYIHLYWDENCENYVTVGETVAKGDGESNPVIYAKYLKGSWTAVKTANQAANMLRATGNGNYFVVYDNIDCASASFTYKTDGSFGGIIEGNGKTLLNVNISVTKQNAEAGSILGNLTSSARVKNLKIENVNIELKLNGTMSAYVFVSSVAEGAVIEGVEVTGVKFSISMSGNASLDNIQYVSDAYQTDNWLYGVYDTDAEFIEKYGDIVKNATLIINGKEIVSGGQL